ncbi:MAG: hypothetical protein AAFV07_12365 [Bacteroidota bacterium]
MKPYPIARLLLCVWALITFTSCKEDVLPKLKSFRLTAPVSASGIIDQETGLITLNVPHGTDLSEARASVTLSEGSEISPDPEMGIDLSSLARTFVVETGEERETYRLEINITPPNLPDVLKSWYKVFGNEGIGAATGLGDETDDVLLFNRAGTRYAHIVNNEVQGFFDLDDPLGRLSGCPLNQVGAAQLHRRGTIFLFDAEGTNYVGKISDGSWQSSAHISAWGGNNDHPFRNAVGGTPAGVEAALYSNANSDVLNFVTHFNATGNQWGVYSNNSERWTGSRPLSTFGGNGIPFQNVSAACRIKTNVAGIYPGEQGERVLYALFNWEGTAVVFYSSILRKFSEVYPLVE